MDSLLRLLVMGGLITVFTNVDAQAQLTQGDRIVFFGDSITQFGGQPKGYVTLFRTGIEQDPAGKQVEVINAGISGHRVPDLEKRIERDVLSKQPTIVVIYIGINDVWHSQNGRGTSKGDFEAGLRRIIQRIKDAKAKVILCTPSVIGEKTDGSNKLDAMLDEYSDISRKVAKDTGSQLLDLRKRFITYLKKNNRDQQTDKILTTDGVHLNDVGNRFVSRQVLAAVKAETAEREKLVPSRQLVYKTVGDIQLRLHVFDPPKKDDKIRPAIVFFFGGGWNGGSPDQFYPHCAHLAELGVVAMSAEYRIKSKHNTTPFECVKDGKSAIRWVRAHAAELGIDPNAIAAGGGSAGGHVAATTGMVPGLDEAGEESSVSCRPDALVLFNPVYDNGPDGYGYSRVKDRFKEISPLHNIGKHTPPTIVFLGTEDKLIPVKTAELFRDKMRALGIKSELKLYEGATHGFFNLGKGDGSAYRQTVAEMDEFLRSIDFLAPIADN